MALSDAALRAFKPGEKVKKISDGGGLFVEVTTTGSKLWRFAYRFEGKQKLLALGSYPLVSLRLGGPSATYYLREFDAGAEGGKGRVAVTEALAEALRFSSWEEASELCQRQSTVALIRHDGKPNRPLSAVAIEIVEGG